MGLQCLRNRDVRVASVDQLLNELSFGNLQLNSSSPSAGTSFVGVLVVHSADRTSARVLAYGCSCSMLQEWSGKGVALTSISSTASFFARIDSARRRVIAAGAEGLAGARL